MRKLTVFNHVSLDGFFCDADGDIRWAHERPSNEWNDWTSSNAQGDSMLLFGRITYEMMASYWPTADAKKNMPAVAEGINAAPKIVFSRTLKNAAWQNTTLIKDDMVGAVQKLKRENGPDMLIMGSGTVVSQLTDAKLIDGYQLAINPIVLGSGRTMFNGIQDKLRLNLETTRPFKNGNVVVTYGVAR